jgi:hypothetical protein
MTKTELEIKSNDGARTARILLPSADTRPSVIAISYHKAGTVMFSRILQELCDSGQRSYVQWEEELVGQGQSLPEFSEAVASLLVPRGYIYGVFRTYPEALSAPSARELVKLCLIRDPRDVVVSFYYSMRQSHPLPIDGAARQAFIDNRSYLNRISLDEAIVSNYFDSIFPNMAKIAALISDKQTIVYRYENVIFSKSEWIKDIASKLYIDVPDGVLAELITKVDVFPPEEQPAEHIRRVIPGDYYNKMSQESLVYLEERYQSVLEELGYGSSTRRLGMSGCGTSRL